jgi:hypothetical protein
MRAHRTSYLDRSMVDLMRPGLAVGVLNARPIDLAQARGVAEYLWYQQYRNVGGFKVLSSFGWEQGVFVFHTIFAVETTFGDWGVCDELRVYRLDYRITRTTGEVGLNRTLQRTVTGTCN